MKKLALTQVIKMADITKCNDDSCPDNYQCFRYLIPNGTRQSYFYESPRFNGRCNFLWKVGDFEKLDHKHKERFLKTKKLKKKGVLK